MRHALLVPFLNGRLLPCAGTATATATAGGSLAHRASTSTQVARRQQCADRPGQITKSSTIGISNYSSHA